MFENLYNYYKTKYFDKVKNEPAPIREALIFKYTTENIFQYIKKDDYIAGWFGKNDSDYKLSDIKDFEYNDSFSENEKKMSQILNNTYLIDTCYATGHTCIDYRNIINNGLISYEKQIKKELKKSENTNEKNIYLKAMLISIDAVRIYAERFSLFALDMANKTNNSDDKKRYTRISDTMKKVPYNPAENFFEALSAVWTMHCMIPISDHSWGSISLGKFDQYMYPFYKKSLKNGDTRENIKEYLKNFFLLLDSYADGACALNIGGMDNNGNDLTNDLSLLLIEVEKEMRLRAPIFVVRINPSFPEDVFDSLIDFNLFSIGQPTFYSELNCRKAMELRGVDNKKSTEFSVNSCMGITIAGEEISNMWACKFNTHLPLELAINNGKPLHGDLPFKLKTPPTKVANLNDLIEIYGKYYNEIFEVIAHFTQLDAINCEKNSPNPLLSAITKGCIDKGVDRAVGAKYNTETIENMGMINTGDAISAINTLVFEKKKYTLKEFAEAAKFDFTNNTELLNDIKECPKYGTGSKKADEICRRLTEKIYLCCLSRNKNNLYYIPSLHTIHVNIDYGYNLYTTLDGRIKGTPVNKNANPSALAKATNPTSVIISAATLGQERFSGGQPIDLFFDKSLFETKEKRDNIKTLVKTYFELGGLQLQVNSVNPELLKKAYDNPEEHRDIIVRKGGFSERFVEMPKNVQAEFIKGI